MIEKKVRKKIIFDRLNFLLLERSYKLLNSRPGLSYLKRFDDKVYFCVFNFNENGTIGASSLMPSIFEVEDVILNIGIPTNTLISYKPKDELFLNSVKDFSFKTLFKNKYMYNFFKKKEEVEEFADWLVNYLEKSGFKFVEHYSFLPNILAKVNQLEVDGKYGHEIIAGGAAWLFRLLIISKLCNDPEFERRLKWVDSLMFDEEEGLTEWHPYYTKLKKKLLVMTSKYNISDGSVLQIDGSVL